MAEANLNGRIPVACVLACAGPIMENTVEYVLLSVSCSSVFCSYQVVAIWRKLTYFFVCTMVQIHQHQVRLED